MIDRVLQFFGRTQSLSSAARAGLAIAVVLVAAGLRWAAAQAVGTSFVTVTFFPAVAIAAMMGGLAPGIVATLLSAAFIYWGFGSHWELQDIVGVSIFLLGCAVIVLMARAFQAGQAQLLAAEAEARRARTTAEFVRQAPAAMAMFDRQMRYIAFSRQWASDYRLGERDLCGLPHYEVFPEIGERWKAVHRRALGGEVVSAQEDLFERADGPSQWLRWEVKPWRGENDEIAGVIIFTEDITARKLAEAERRRSEGLFQAIFDNAQVGIAQFGDGAAWLRVNERFCEITGYGARELACAPVQKVVHPDDVQKVTELIRRLLDGKIENFVAEERFLHRDGSTVWVSLSARKISGLFDHAGQGVVVVEDISERKRVEAALAEQRQRLAADLDAMTRLSVLGTLVVQDNERQPVLDKVIETAQAIASADYGCVRLVDATTGRLTIAAACELPSAWVQLWTEKPEAATWREEARVTVEDVEATSAISPDVVEICRKTGVRSIVSVSLFTRSKKFVGVVTVLYRAPAKLPEQTLRLLDLLGRHAADILDHMQAGARLRDSEARYRAIVDTSAASIVTVDEEGRLLTANPATQTIFGYAPETLIGENFAILMQSQDAGGREAYGDALRRGDLAEVVGAAKEVEGRRKDGSSVQIELSVSEWRDDAGKRFFTGAMTDIGARKQTEDALRKFLRVIEQTATTVVITDRNGVIEYVNPGFEASSGYSAAEAIGRKPSLLKSGLTPDEQYRDLWRTINAGGVWRGEFRNRRKDGSLYWEAATISAVRDASGRATHFAAVKEDITIRKEIEGQLAAAQRTEAIGRLAGSVAHDFNNLLAVIAGNLELILTRTDDPRIVALVRPALESAEAGGAYTRRLLTLGAPRPAAPAFLSPNDRIRSIRTLLERISGKGIAWTYVFADDLWSIMADPGEVDSSLLNLATNSRDAMPNGGEIVLETLNVTLSAGQAAALSRDARAGEYVCLAMSDSGVGMRKEVLTRAFEPFFTTKSEGKGTGLGLSGVKSFVNRVGGFVTMVSREDDGTTVSLYFPRANPEANAAQIQISPNVPVGEGESVLIVDDDDRVREVTMKRVEALGYVVEPARSGAEAIAALQSGIPVDLVLSDIIMPGGMNGFELAKWVRAHNSGVKVALITGFNGGFAGDAPVELDAPVLQKPFTREQLAETIACALHGSSHAMVTSPANT